MHVHHINRIRIEYRTHLPTRPGVDGQFERHAGCHSMETDAVDNVGAGEDSAMTGRGGDDANLVPSCDLPTRQCPNLRLDTAGSGREAVADVGHPHGP